MVDFLGISSETEGLNKIFPALGLGLFDGFSAGFAFSDPISLVGGVFFSTFSGFIS